VRAHRIKTHNGAQEMKQAWRDFPLIESALFMALWFWIGYKMVAV